MSLATMMETPCTIVHRSLSGKDELGDETRTETLVASTCSLQQIRTDEPDDAGEVSVTTWDLFLPTGTQLRTGDAVIVGSAEYEVVGDPWDATEGSPHVWHVEARVKAVRGAGDAS